MKSYFEKLVANAIQALPADEKLLINYSGECSDFVRFNHAQIRQPGSVYQQQLSLRLIRGQKHAQTTFPVTGNLEPDLDQIHENLKAMRDSVPALPDDPYLLYNTQTQNTEVINHPVQSTTHQDMVMDILQLSEGLDMVGIFAAGTMASGFANSLGQFNWFETENFNFDFSLYHSGDKAVKGAYSGTLWEKHKLAQKINEMREQLVFLARPSKTIPPGQYRCYLAPDAVNELLGLLNWGGFSYDAARSHTSPIMPLVNKEATLNNKVNINNAPNLLGVPGFDAWGFSFDNDVQIIKNGKIESLLVSARDAQEHNISANNPFDYSNALSLAAGNLDKQTILQNLDTGIYISNLWYCNYSDRPRGRITGMTRFASFWVENGEIIAPLNVMRFDDSALSLFGDQLIDLDNSATRITDSSTYEARQFAASLVPGILVKRMTFTL